MRNYGVAAVFVGGIFLTSIPSAMAQTTNVAYAAEPRPDYVVFLDTANRLSGTALDTVRVAADAARSGKSLQLVGRAANAEAVKKELIREGVPAGSIVVRRDTDKPLPRVADGIAEPSDRHVQILF